jgi:hypothetical protein
MQTTAVLLGPERALPRAPSRRFVEDEESENLAPARIPNLLFVDTQPRQADVWVDGEWKGKSPLRAVIGPGGKRLLIVLRGFWLVRDAVDATRGAIVRRALVPIEPPMEGDGFLNVQCRTFGKLPVFLDERETGLLCPAKMVPARAGKHRVGVFVPSEARIIASDVEVAAGPQPIVVDLAF